MVIRWGFIGLGNIAHRFACDLVNQAKNATLEAVASRDLHRSQQFAAKFACSSAYGDYLTLLRDPHVDCVYVSTIHPQHRNVVELCLTHGKHVLVEKPAFTTRNDWDDMTRLAQQNNLLMVEAMKSVTFPAYRKLIAFLSTNNVTLTSINASFAGIQPFAAQNRLFNPQLGGGATLDVAVYPLWLFYDLCRWTNTTAPNLHGYLSNYYPQSPVEDHSEFLASDKVSAYLCGSLSQERPRHAEIKGENLDITIFDKWWNPSKIEICYMGNEIIIDEAIRGGGFVYEIEHISELIIQGRRSSEWIPAEISRQVIQLMEESIASFTK
jgi:predicted dehydrogenase